MIRSLSAGAPFSNVILRHRFENSIIRLSEAKKRFSTGAELKLTKEEAQGLWKRAQAVCFDVDSTVIQEEGIDVLADFKGKGPEVAELTKKAMGGTVLFQDALQMRLSIIEPSKQDITDCMKKHPLEFTPKIKEVIEKLHKRGTYVYLVSGGFRQMIYPIADKLSIPRHRVFANNLLFDRDTGKFAGFDPSEPTSRDGGKPAVVQRLKNEHGYTPIIMVGDGATDMQARPPADAFIGFGGVVQRDVVKNGADWYVLDFQEILDIMD